MTDPGSNGCERSYTGGIPWGRVVDPAAERSDSGERTQRVGDLRECMRSLSPGTILRIAFIGTIIMLCATLLYYIVQLHALMAEVLTKVSVVAGAATKIDSNLSRHTVVTSGRLAGLEETVGANCDKLRRWGRTNDNNCQ